MNIFVTDLDPIVAAINLCDKHVVKMCLETAQLLCSPFPKGTAPYRTTHINHPCSIWARESIQNYHWLVTHGTAISAEYTSRYKKRHASAKVIAWCENNYKNLFLPDIGLTEFPQCVPQQYKQNDVVNAYRQYYLAEKSRFAKWKYTHPPYWWINSDL